jgi:hypothetical protein
MGLTLRLHFRFRVCAANASGESAWTELEVRTRAGRVFSHLYDFDTNGLLYHLATAAGTKEWVRLCLLCWPPLPALACMRVFITAVQVNPATLGAVSVHRSMSGVEGDVAGPVHGVLERDPSHTDHLCSIEGTCAGLWFVLELHRDVALIPTAYTLRHDSGHSDFLRNWTFDGSVDGRTWHTLRTHTEDDSLCLAGATATWEITAPSDGSKPASAASAAAAAAPSSSSSSDSNVSASPIAYRYFRILTTGPSSSGTHTLVIAGIELYGQTTSFD